MSIKGATYVKEHGANAGLDLIEVPDDVLEILGAGEEPEPVEEETKENVDESASETVPEQGAEEADAEEEASEEGEVLEKKPPTRKEKRIEQLVYERKQAEERAAAEAAARELDRQRIQELEARLKEVQKGRSDGESALIAEKIEMARAKRKQASEEADLEAFAEANDTLTDLLLQQQRVTTTPEPSEPPRQTTSTPPRQDDLHPAAKAWLTRNVWYLDPGQQEKANRAYSIQNELLSQGYGFGDKMYEELDRRLSESATSVESQKPAEPETKKSSLPPAMGSPTSSDTATRQSKPKPGELTEYDIQAIKLAQLDPNDPNVRKTYLRYKRKTA